jgi:hypothetical protein
MLSNRKNTDRKNLIKLFLILILLLSSSCSTVTVDNSQSPIVENNLSPAGIRIAKNSTETSCTVSLTVCADNQDKGILSYQWYMATSADKDGVLLKNETKNIYTFDTKDLGQKYYYCIVSNRYATSRTINTSKYRSHTISVKSITKNSCTSSINKLHKNIAFPSIQTTSELLRISPYNYLVNSGDSMDLICLTGEDDDKTLSYQWYKSLDKTSTNGILINGATNNSYSTEYFKNLGINYYYCIVTNTINDSNGTTKNASTTSPIFSIAYTGLPTLYINTNNSKITKKEYVEDCSFKLIDKEFGEVEYENLKIKGRGNSTWGMPKSSYTLKLKKKKSLLGMPKDKKWVLVANYIDTSLLRNYYVSHISNKYFDNMEWNPTFNSVDLVLDSKYLGTYILGEKIKISDGRVNIQDMSDIKDDINNDGLVDINDGGFIVEINERMDEDYNFRTTKKVAFSLSDPDDKEDVSEDMFNYVKNIVQKAEDALFSDSFMDEDEGYSKYIDVDSVIDWYIVNEFTKNIDAAFYSSVYMYYNPIDQKIYMGPNWDYDLSSGNTNYSNCDDYKSYHIKNTKWFARMFEDPTFVAKVQSRWKEIQKDLKTSVDQEIQNEANDIEVSATCNFLKWPVLGSYIFHNDPGYAKRKTYQSEVDYFVTWLDNRYDWMNDNLQKI